LSHLTGDTSELNVVLEPVAPKAADTSKRVKKNTDDVHIFE